MIRLPVDLANPAHFFGCCGVFELAHRLWPWTTAHFDRRLFIVDHGDLAELVESTVQSALEVLEPAKQRSSALRLGAPFDLQLNWWKFEPGLKTWAGQMSVSRIASSLQRELPSALQGAFFDAGRVLFGEDGQKVEPFYFDGRRGSSALPLDVGFSADGLEMKTLAYSACEFFTLIGLQRFRPSEVRLRAYRYCAWRAPLPVTLAALAAAGVILDEGPTFQFESTFRTGQRKHKAFSPAIPTPKGDGHE